MRLRRFSLVIAVAALWGQVAQAQGGRRGTSIRIPYRTYVAINPLLVPFDIGSFELETAVAPGVTVGATASYTNVDDSRFSSFDLALRYYPGEVVLRGFSIGLSGGFLGYRTTMGPDDAHVTLEAPTAGVVLDYNWMLGVSRRFLIGTGIGAKRVLANREERSSVDMGRAYMTARFVVGYAF